MAEPDASEATPEPLAACPCCTGEVEGAWERLCDVCLDGWWNQDWDHECDRPLEARNG